MGKKKGNKNKAKGGGGDGGPSSSSSSSPYRVGVMGDLIASSCGVEKPKYDPKLEALFSSSVNDKRGIKLVEKKGKEALPVPVVKKEKEKKLGNKDAAEIRVESKAKVLKTIKKGNVQNNGVINKKKKPKDVKNNKKSLKTSGIGNDEAESGDDDKPEDEPAAEGKVNDDDEESEDNDQDEEGEETSVPPHPLLPHQKTLKEQNAPKEKNPELESRTLFVGNVPKDATKKQILKLFASLGGKVETIRLRCGAPDKPTKLKKVAINRKELHPGRESIAAYIRYSSREEAEQILEKGKAEGLKLAEHRLVLDLADGSIKKDNKKAIFVGNLHLKVQDDEIWEFFSQCGQVESVHVVRDRESGLGKGFGYVNFGDSAAVELALQKNGQEFKNRELRISRCVKKQKKTDQREAGGRGGGKGPNQSGKSFQNKRADKKRISQGQRQRKEPQPQDYSGTKTAESGKLKRHSKKPNKEDLKKAKFAMQLTNSALSKTEYLAKKKEMRKKTKQRWPKEKKMGNKKAKSKP